LNAFKPMYDLLNWDPWSYYSVTTNADRSVATIKQFTRWGISDIYFCAIYWGKCEVVNAEVKRFKTRAALLSTGRQIDDIDHVMKCLGFDADFSVDRMHHTKENLGPFPNRDFRRWIMSDQSAIDASRFNSVNLSPAVQMWASTTLWYHQHPKDSKKLIGTGMLPINFSQPELGSPAYHYEPRIATQMYMLIGSVVPELGEFDWLGGQMKKGSMMRLGPPHIFQQAIKAEWDYYCHMFMEEGIERPYPHYPYTVEYMEDLLVQEQELAKQEEDRARTRWEKAYGGTEPQGPHAFPEMKPGDALTWEPAKAILNRRARSPSPTVSKEQRNAWLKQGHDVKRYLQNKAPAPEKDTFMA